MRVLFAGSPAAALPTLQALVESRHDVVGVLTQPPRPAGRKRVPVPTAVEVWARESGIPVHTPEDSEGIQRVVEELVPDIAIVVAYGRILDEPALSAVTHGWWNVHFSLLPRWRGASPVHHALAAGDTTTGITLFRIVPELDAGPVVSSTEVVIEPHETEGNLVRRLAKLAPPLVLELLSEIESGSVTVHEQTGQPSFAPKLPKGAGSLNLSHDLENVYRAFRSFTPEPGAFVVRADTGQNIKILGAWPHPSADNLEAGGVKQDSTGVLLGTGTAPLVLLQVKPAGKSDMSAEDWFRGLPSDVKMHVGSD